jgi:signal transduction histidine kinase
MPSTNLLNRLSSFLQTSQSALVSDCESVLQMESPSGHEKGSAFGWRNGLGQMIKDVAKQLGARAAGEGWNVGGAISDEGGADHGAIQCLLLEASLVRNFFLRALNRFQATQAGLRDFTAAEMTETRQEAMEIFDRVTTSALSNWIRKLQSGPPAASNPEPAAPAAETPESPTEAEAPADDPPNDPAAATVEELLTCVHAISTQIGKLRAITPAGKDGPAVAVMRHLQRMSSLLESLGAPGRRGQDPAIPETARVAPLAVRAFTEALAEAFRPLAEQKGLRFAVHVDSGLQTVETDAPKLHRAASLLIGNAVHYTVKGGVSLSARVSAGDWLLSIEDTGPGIEPEKLTRLLTGAVLGPDRVPHGLAVTRELVQLLGGHLDADSVVRRGSRFTICLPRARRVAPAEAGRDAKKSG